MLRLELLDYVGLTHLVGENLWRFFPSIILTILLLSISACGNVAQDSQKNESQEIETTDSFLNDLWSFELTQTYDYEDQEPAPSCEYNLYELWVCEFWYYVTNETKTPQEYDGYTYLVTDDGRVFESTEKPEYERLNPGEGRLETPSFIIPDEGVVAVSIFRAWTASDNKYYEYVFPIRWNLSN